MKILALITARAGSKRLPGKNINILGDRPLISWSIDALKKSSGIIDILVSTNDQDIFNIAINEGLLIPWLRPENLSSDTSTSVDVAIHALDWYENMNGEIDGLILIQPTSPFRTVETIERGIKMFIESTGTTVLGVSPTHHHPYWTFKEKNGYLLPFIRDGGINILSQDLEKAYVVNGSLYLISSINLRKQQSFYTDETIPLIINSKKESLDIDDEDDWALAEYYLNK
jgi:CMP-N,N'-diacetyllegionaminic acid synthase